MRVLMLSWEYPPRIVGGIARHVEELAWELAALSDVEVHVITCSVNGAPNEEIQEKVHIHRVDPAEAEGGYADFIHWVHRLNDAMRDRAHTLIESWLPSVKSKRSKSAKTAPAKPEIILHAHDWLTYFSAVELKHKYKIPLAATIHATEFGRNSGIHSEISRYIDHIERQLITEAWRVIVCSDFMKGEVEYALLTPPGKIDVIYNGVRVDKFTFDFSADEAAHFRSKFAHPSEKLIMFVGRGVREKGCQVLIDALPKVRAVNPNTKLVICGGGYRDHLMSQARALGVWDNVYFTGFTPDDDLLRLYRVADAACFPSLYEPFGIVALEAMAAHCPVIVSDAGGLREVVIHNETGITTWLNNSDSLAWGILQIILNPQRAHQLAHNAFERTNALFNWKKIAEETHDVYTRILQEYSITDW